ncbi:MAG: LysR family transcriptional regulator [Proteobacteria bacterium]|nr:LysR family transcriptional regulator [Pseudomonadota bacterium]
MDINLPTDVLRSFVAVADTGSFTQAAGRVFRTQSAVSQQIQRLEASIGQTLLLREGRHARLTAEGESLLGYARRILKLHDEAVSAIAEPDMEGVVSFGMPDDYAAGFLPPILTSFAASYPRVRLELICEPSSQLVPAIQSGALDVAIISWRQGMPQPEVVRREHGAWATSKEHLVHEEDVLPVALFEPG